MRANPVSEVRSQVRIPAGSHTLAGELAIPEAAKGVVLFAHGSGSSRFSRRNQIVAVELRRAGLGTLLFDLLTAEEERADQTTGRFRFDVALLAERIAAATVWLKSSGRAADLPVGYFGASTGAAAALVASAALGGAVRAVVSRGGRPDLAGGALPYVQAPTLLIVGGRDPEVLELNRNALASLRCPAELVVIPGATHLFEEPGTLAEVSNLAAGWFRTHLRPRGAEEAREPLGVTTREE